MNENIILIDWFAFSAKSLNDPQALIDSLGLGGIKFTNLNGHYGYKQAKYYGGIWVLYDGREDMGVCFEMSGQGCRQYETSAGLPLVDFVQLVASNEIYHITRLDVAYDDIDHKGDGLLNVSKIDKLARADLYCSKLRSKSGTWSGMHDEDSNKPSPLAYSVYFGSATSNLRIRIYDKSLERGGLGYHWTRCELQLRDDAAYNFIREQGDVGYKYAAVLNHYIRFVIPDKHDSNRRRWKSPKWWTDFVGAVGKISLYTPKGIDYNLSRLEHYIYEQAGNSLYAFVQCVGTQYFWLKLKEREQYLNANQRDLIAEYSELRKQLHDELHSSWEQRKKSHKEDE